MRMSPFEDHIEFDLLGIGNAIVDVLAETEDTFLTAHDLVKGSMTLVDAPMAERLYHAMGPAIEVSGGSCANTVAGAAMLGASAAYIGKTAPDQLGEIFGHDLRALGVSYRTPFGRPEPPTARCFVLVSADAQRTMATYLGACVELGPEDIDPDLVARARVLYLEGYLWDPPRAKDALRYAMQAAKDADRTVALSLSDTFCVERHRVEFQELVSGPVDIMFANEAEALAISQQSTLSGAVEWLTGRCALAIITRGAKGAMVISADGVHEVAAIAPAAVVDTTGAGDLFAAGFLFGYTRGWDPVACARAGAAAASEVIAHFGARPERDLIALVEHAIQHKEQG